MSCPKNDPVFHYAGKDPQEPGDMDDPGTSDPTKLQISNPSPRSSSVDEGERRSTAPSTPKSEGSSLLSRFAKTFEDKMTDLKHEKQQLFINLKDSFAPDDPSSSDVFPPSPKLEPTPKFEASSSRSSLSEEAEPRKKGSLVQDITEQTNKFKSDFHKFKISELRQRRSSKEGKSKTSLLSTILKKEDDLVAPEMIHEAHVVDSAVEAKVSPIFGNH